MKLASHVEAAWSMLDGVWGSCSGSHEQSREQVGSILLLEDPVDRRQRSPVWMLV